MPHLLVFVLCNCNVSENFLRLQNTISFGQGNLFSFEKKENKQNNFFQIYLHCMMLRLLFLLYGLFSFVCSFSELSPHPSDEEIKHLLSTLTLEQKVGQLFITFFHGNSVNESTKNFIQKNHLGNFIYFTWANELSDPSSVRQLSEDLFKCAYACNQLPPLICIDQEGGIVSRLQKGYTQFPGNMALAATEDEDLAFQMGVQIARELKASGITLNLAPIVDVNSNLQNPLIGTRSFSDNPKVITKFAQKIIAGFHQEGVAATLKHFPGHGDTTKDSHTQLPFSSKKIEALFANEILPFSFLKNVTDCIMTAHVIYPAFDSHRCATLSPIILTNLLRHFLKYEGVIISDSLMMRSVSPAQASFEEAVAAVSESAIQAFLAGCDMMIVAKLEWADFLPTQEEDQELIGRVVENFKTSIENGRIPYQRLEESLVRILRLKARYTHPPIPNTKVLPNEELAHQICTKALTLLSPESLWNEMDIQLSNKKWIIVAPEEIKSTLIPSLSKEFSFSPTLFFFTTKDLEKNFTTVFSKAKECIVSHDKALFLAYNAHLSLRQKELLVQLAQEFDKEKLIIAALRNPQDIIDIHHHLSFLTYSHSVTSLSTLFQALEKKELPKGKMPLQISLSHF